MHEVRGWVYTNPHSVETFIQISLLHCFYFSNVSLYFSVLSKAILCTWLDHYLCKLKLPGAKGTDNPPWSIEYQHILLYCQWAISFFTKLKTVSWRN